MQNKKNYRSKELNDRLSQFLESIPLCSCSTVEEHIIELHKAIPEENELFPIVEFCKIFSNLNRLKIIFLLLNKSPRCNCEIEALLKVGQSTISHHIQVLEEKNFISIERKGKWSLYSLKNHKIANLLSQVMNVDY
ncbi:MAG: ArsR/SmtB family transcription factor [Candidatus Hodarchaeota archaeon]